MTPFGGPDGLQGRTVWVLSNLDWTAPWQPAQELAVRLARANRVTFVETTARRLPRPGDAPRLVRRLARPARRPVDRGVHVVSPRALPLPASRRAARLNARALLRLLEPSADPPVVWAHLPSPTLLALLDLVPDATLVYHCLLDFSALPNAPAGVAEVEREVVERAALVVVDSATLLHERGWAGPHVACLPSGADVAAFARETPVAPDVEALPHPVAGFAGSIDYRIDAGLLGEAAARAPDWTFALVGPVARAQRRSLAGVPNVRLLGPRAHRDLPAAVAGFDVGLIPYADLPVRRTTFPAKLYEYLAAGLPVVATQMPDLEPFAPHVRLVADAPALAEALASADRSEAARRHRSALAAANDWARREADWGRLLRDAGLAPGLQAPAA